MWKSSTLDPSPPARGGHCLTALPDGSCVLIGGIDRNGNRDTGVWLLSGGPAGMHWERKEAACADGVKLEPRTGATAVAVGRKVYLYGGLQPHSGLCFGDVLVLDTETWAWSKLAVQGGAPPARHSHSACVVHGDKMVIFGGAGADQASRNDTHVLDIAAASWEERQPRGEVPCRREMHAAVALPGSEDVLVFGGRSADGEVLGDFFTLDTKAFAWRKSAQGAHPRCSHSVALNPRESQLLAFGGFDGAAPSGGLLRFSLGDGLRASAVSPAALMPESPGQPCARFAQAGAGVQWGEGAFAFIVFGGVSAEEDHRDLCVWVERTGQ